MLIVCPSCATSYMIDPAAVGPAGRTVRCARCKTTWFAGGPNSVPAGPAFADNATAEAETQPPAPDRAEAAQPPPEAAQPEPMPAATDDFGAEASESITAIETETPPVEPPPPETTPAPAEAQAPEPEPATIADAPSLVPPIEHEWLPEVADAELESEEFESFAARRRRLRARRKRPRRSSRWTALILVLVAFNVALVGARNDLVRYLPQTASLFAAIGLPVNLRHLKFENVRISKEAQDGINILVVQGAIVNEAGTPAEVPRLRFAARNATGQEIYTWTALAARGVLGPGERLEFRNQIPAPPTEATDVIVRFFTAQDAGAK